MLNIGNYGLSIGIDLEGNTDRLEEIFNQQLKLIQKFHEIEKQNGTLQTQDFPVNLHDRFGQARLKDMAWRFTEEISEALEVYLNEGPREDLKEEFIDGLHFLTEFTINTGYLPSDIVTGEDKLQGLVNQGKLLSSETYYDSEQGTDLTMDRLYMHLMMNLGMTCNTLRNKPWKQKLTETNSRLFLERLTTVWCLYFAMMTEVGMTSGDIYEGYMSKHKKNQQRIKDGI